jgi:hypothetical protein
MNTFFIGQRINSYEEITQEDLMVLFAKHPDWKLVFIEYHIQEELALEFLDIKEVEIANESFVFTNTDGLYFKTSGFRIEK